MTFLNESFYCGMDIGGANTKYIVLREETYEQTRGFSGKRAVTIDSKSIYFPFWERKNQFPGFINSLIETLEKKYSKINFGITITAELSDAFETKMEGIEFITKSISSTAAHEPLFYATNGSFLPAEEGILNWPKTAASNWHATATLIGRFFINALLVDIGSTTTDIIGIQKGKPRPFGLTDLERLQTGELVFVGALRTNLATLSNELMVGGRSTQTSTEFFACTGDILRVLGKMKPQEYSIPTPDARSVSIKHCLGRIARVVCADMNILSNDQIAELATQFLAQIQERIRQGLERQIQAGLPWPPKAIVLAGIGAKTLGKDLIRSIDSKIVFLSDVIGEKEAEIAPAYAVALLLKDWLTSRLGK